MPWACSLLAAAISPTRSLTLREPSAISLEDLGDFLADLHAVLGVLDRLLDHVGGVLGGLGGPLGQVADFLGHHGKALARLAGPGGLDGGVQGQQVGLEGDLVDGLDDLGGLVAGLLDVVDGLAHAAHRLGALVGAGLRRRPARFLAWSALSAFCLVMEAISSTLEVVSSMAAACSLAPWASDWLAADTCPAALAVCSAPPVSPAMIAADRPGDAAGDEHRQQDAHQHGDATGR